jgi:hypothetical protein
MSMDEPKQFPVPADVGDVTLFIMQISQDLPDMFACEARDLIKEMATDYKAWKMGEGKEPNWNSFRISINAMCEDEGMPILFEDLKINED